MLLPEVICHLPLAFGLHYCFLVVTHTVCLGLLSLILQVLTAEILMRTQSDNL